MSFEDLYVPGGSGYDECVDAGGGVRPHWAGVADVVRAAGIMALERRRIEAGRLLADQGVTYNVHGDPLGRPRRWDLDPVPIVFESEEWSRLEAGLSQRAELLALLLDDLYGSRESIRNDIIPADLIQAHTGFLRPCQGLPLVNRSRLHLYAADLARKPSGELCVLADRTQAPSGAGYALANRSALARAFPPLFRDARVERLAPFFRALRQSLRELSPRAKDEPRVVVFTPGPHNETYFEHAYLAAFLGFTLAEGADLTVRGGRLWLRTLGDLEEVDVVLRRVDESFSDPVELRADSRLGVPGLLEVIRRGNVAMANPIGSGVLESPGLLPFLPLLARHFLGEALLLPSVTSWWCGESDARAHVLAHLGELVIRPIDRKSDATIFVGPLLDRAALGELRARIEARPHAWVGQELVELATVPVLGEQKLVPRHSVTRAFAVSRSGSWVTMRGGLTRFAPAKDDVVVSGQRGGKSKDTWVIAAGARTDENLWLEGAPRALELIAGSALSSGAAENLFWLGRYAERTEACGRAWRVAVECWHEHLEYGDESSRRALDVILAALSELTATYPGFTGDGGAERRRDPGPELESVLFDAERSGTLVYDLRRLLDAADGVRDHISPDTQRTIRRLEDELDQLLRRSDRRPEAMQLAVSSLINVLAGFAGSTAESMSRGPAWRFLDAGRRIERAMSTIALLRTTLVPVLPREIEALVIESMAAALDVILESRVRRRPLVARAAIEALVCDDRSPRSLAFQVVRLEEHAAHFPRRRVRYGLSREERLVVEVSAALRIADPAELHGDRGWRAERGDGDGDGDGGRDEQLGGRTSLALLLTRVQDLLWRLVDVLDETFFRHLAERHCLGPVPPESPT